MALTFQHTDKTIQIYDGQLIGEVRLTFNPNTIEPHVEWIGASARQMLAGTVAVLSYLRTLSNVVVLCLAQYRKWFDGLARRGILRAVGYLSNLSEGDIYIYQVP